MRVPANTDNIVNVFPQDTDSNAVIVVKPNKKLSY